LAAAIRRKIMILKNSGVASEIKAEVGDLSMMRKKRKL